MKIENPTELASLVAKNDELTAQLAEFEAMKAEFETLKASFEEMTTEVSALQEENTELKEAVAANAEVGEQIKTEVAKNVELTEMLETAKSEYVETLIARDNEIAELKKAVAVSKEVADAAVDETVAVQTQFKLVAEHLTPKGAVPDLEATQDNKASEVFATWKKLSSGTPEQRIAARKLRAKHAAEIDAQMNKNLELPTTTASSASKPSAEDLAIYEEWRSIRQASNIALGSAFGTMLPVERHKVNALKNVEARKFYNKHRAVIDSCIAAEAN